MQLYNTRTRQVETFYTLDGRKIGEQPAPLVKMYSCGPTVYDYTHLGHLRKYTMDDILVRILRHAGYEVKQVRNITDVGHLVSDDDDGEDKMEKKARQGGTSAQEIAQKFENYFLRSMDLMGNLRPSISCRATDYIQNQLELVLSLERQGYTYIIEGNGVYFDTSKIADYGQLAGLNAVQQREGARVAKVAGKRHATDFALWKFAKPADHRQMVWPSPWAALSFPGWHVECSAMSIEHLGPQLDIHTGGIDLIPIHHCNEIAQSEAYTGKKPFVNFWVHSNFLLIDGEKMSKSLGNFLTIDDILTRGYSPQALRLLFLMAHYRREQNFTFASLQAASKLLLRLKQSVLQLRAAARDEHFDLLDFPEAVQWREAFFAKIENDLNTAEALVVLQKMLGSNLDHDAKYYLLLEFDRVLGLNLVAVTAENFATEIEQAKQFKIIEADFFSAQRSALAVSDLPLAQQKLFQQREVARQAKDYQLADKLRQALEAAGYQLVDRPDGVQIFAL